MRGKGQHATSMTKTVLVVFRLLLAPCGSLASDRTTSLLPSWLDAGRQTGSKRQGIARNMLRASSSVEETTRRLQESQENCEAAAQDNEDFMQAIGLQCQCIPRDAGTLLACIDQCAYCNDEQTVCGLQSAQTLFDSETGLRVGVGGVFDYLTGFHDTSLAIENINCIEENGVITSCDTCNFYVNGEKCSSCELKNCTSGSQAEVMNCENIESGAVYDFCETVNIPEDSVFTALSTSQFEECVQLDALTVSSEEEGKGKGMKKSGRNRIEGGSKFTKSEKKAKSR